MSSENSQSDIPHRVRKSIIISAKFYSSQFSVLKDVIGTVENMGVFNRGFGEDTGSRFRVQIVEKNSKMALRFHKNPNRRSIRSSVY